jgi:membrane-associated phospholipid phosphatase
MEKALSALRKNLTPHFPPHYRKAFLLLGIGFFVLFVIFTLIVRADVLRSFDFDTTVRLQEKIPTKVDGFFSFLSVFGRFETSIIILLVILFFKRKILGGVAFAFFGIAHIIEIIGKTFLSQPGPPHMFLRTHDLAAEFPGLYIHTDASFPSGHAMRALFLSTMIVFLIWRNKKIITELRYVLIGLVVIYTFLMVLSRVSLGEHWTTDVVAGSLLGLSFSFISLIFL